MGQKINGRVVLGENVAATQTGVAWAGGKGMFMVSSAAWGGGTAKLEISCPQANSDSVAWASVMNWGGIAASATANAAIPFEAPAGLLRVNIATATGVYAYVVGLHQ